MRVLHILGCSFKRLWFGFRAAGRGSVVTNGLAPVFLYIRVLGMHSKLVTRCMTYTDIQLMVIIIIFTMIRGDCEIVVEPDISRKLSGSRSPCVSQAPIRGTGTIPVILTNNVIWETGFLDWKTEKAKGGG